MFVCIFSVYMGLRILRLFVRFCLSSACEANESQYHSICCCVNKKKNWARIVVVVVVGGIVGRFRLCIVLWLHRQQI